MQEAELFAGAPLGTLNAVVIGIDSRRVVPVGLNPIVVPKH